MSQHDVSGIFKVDLKPVTDVDAPVGALSIEKTFHGDMEGRSSGMMAGYGGGGEGAAAYVAVEQVTAVIEERRGTFVLLHQGTRLGGQDHLIVTVLPGSGSGDLSGIEGTMEIAVTPGSHVYHFRYTLPE